MTSLALCSPAQKPLSGFGVVGSPRRGPEGACCLFLSLRFILSQE